jgi:vesicle transport through interaction with t-SNAREs protein 1
VVLVRLGQWITFFDCTFLLSSIQLVNMSIFDAYDTEFSSLMKEITKNMAEYKDGGDNKEQGVALPQLIEGLFLQSSDLIKQMEIEARSSDAASRKILNDKVAKYKKTVASVKSDYQQSKTQFEKAALINTSSSKSMEQRQRLLDSHEKYGDL